MGHQLGRLCDHGAVDVADLPAVFLHPAQRRGQQDRRICAPKLRIGVGEMGTDVAERRRPQQRVGDGMQQDVRIRMAQQAMGVRYLDTAQDQFAAGDQCVHVPAFADTEIVHVCECESEWSGWCLATGL